MNDPFGEAILDYFANGKASKIIVNSNYTEDEEIPPSWFFRTEKEMPKIEQEALKLCRGKVLDVGAAAGCHSLILQKKGFNVTALEISPIAAEVMKKRGIYKTVVADIFKYSEEKFDTILLLMNGTGIAGTIQGLKKLLDHLKMLLSENGQILVDSSDIKYLFEDDDGSFWVDLANPNYYGEMDYEVSYKDSTSTFKWLFIDFENLKKIAAKLGFDCELILEGKHYDYLAQLKLKNEVPV